MTVLCALHWHVLLCMHVKLYTMVAFCFGCCPLRCMHACAVVYLLHWKAHWTTVATPELTEVTMPTNNIVVLVLLWDTYEILVINTSSLDGESTLYRRDGASDLPVQLLWGALPWWLVECAQCAHLSTCTYACITKQTRDTHVNARTLACPLHNSWLQPPHSFSGEPSLPLSSVLQECLDDLTMYQNKQLTLALLHTPQWIALGVQHKHLIWSI